jgi:hypothetical protein
MSMREAPMVAALVIGATMLAVEPAAAVSANGDGATATYCALKNQAGGGADANLRLALWCESHGLLAERLEHLSRAVLSQQDNPVARALLGMVRYEGRWQHPDEIAERARSDESLQRTLAEYNARRETTPETAMGHWLLGTWCESQGLNAEAIAHFTTVTRFDPTRADAWTRLGCRKVGGRWLSESQIAAEQTEREAQRCADQRWGARLREWWRTWLADPDHRDQLEQAFADELEARAVPSIRTLFDRGTAQQQLFAVDLYDRIDSPQASQDLLRFVAFDRSDEVRQAAFDALMGRDPKEVIEPLIGLMHTPMGVEVREGPDPDSVTHLRVEDEDAVMNKHYVPITRNNPLLRPTGRRTVRGQLNHDLQRINVRNGRRQALNESARSILTALTGKDLGPSPDSWKKWLAEEQGYVYARPYATPKRQFTRIYVGLRGSCFAQGTLVRTLLGPRPIETLSAGDLVLSQDPTTGALSYQAVTVAYHNPPSATLTIGIGTDEIAATPIHRFWRVGKGWALARDLKPGDPIRVLGSVARVTRVEPSVVQPVFNLEVPGGHDYFVGRSGVLVHDNTAVQSISEPFDAPPQLAPVASRSR